MYKILLILCLLMIKWQVTMIPEPNISTYHNNCGTIINQNQKDYLDQTRIDRQNWSQPKSTIWIPVKQRHNKSLMELRVQFTKYYKS